MCRPLKKICGIFLSAWLIAFPFFASAETFTSGTAVLFNDGDNSFPAVTKIDATHVLVAYADDGVGKAVVGTIDDMAISFGSAATFNASSTTAIDVTRLDSTHVVIVYANGTSGEAVIATISDSTVSFGSAATVASDIQSNSDRYMLVASMDATHLAILYSTKIEVAERTYEYATHVVAGTVSGTSITLGSASTLEEIRSPYNAITALDATHFVATYDTNFGVGYAIVGSVSGTDITLGSSVNYVSNSTYTEMVTLSSTKVMLAFRGSGDTTQAIIGTISGTSISFGSTTEVGPARASDISLAPLDSTHAAIVYSDFSDNDNGTQKFLTATDSSVSVDSGVVFTGPVGQQPDTAALDASTIVAVWSDDSNDGYAVVSTTTPTSPTSFRADTMGTTVFLSWTNPTDDDFLSTTIRRGTDGFPATSTGGTAVASGVTATSVSDTGLTNGTYYYSIFAHDVRGNISAAATVGVTISISSTSSSQESGGGTRGSPGRGGTAKPLSTLMQNRDVHASAALQPKTEIARRTCDRVMKWFRNNAKVLQRVNERLSKRFGFSCTE